MKIHLKHDQRCSTPGTPWSPSLRGSARDSSWGAQLQKNRQEKNSLTVKGIPSVPSFRGCSKHSLPLYALESNNPDFEDDYISTTSEMETTQRIDKGFSLAPPQNILTPLFIQDATKPSVCLSGGEEKKPVCANSTGRGDRLLRTICIHRSHSRFTHGAHFLWQDSRVLDITQETSSHRGIFWLNCSCRYVWSGTVRKVLRTKRGTGQEQTPWVYLQFRG